MTILAKKFEIFSGTGGVGKTTLATSRALELAAQGKKVLLITIDPAKRLRQLLGLSHEQAGEIVTLQNPLGMEDIASLDVELMDPEKTFARIAKKCQCPEVLDNRILNILTSPYGGLNEILALVELNMRYLEGKYENIVLDTPPGSHFLDFLDSAGRINVFFDQSFIDIFNYIGKKVDSKSQNLGKKIFTKVVGSGVNKLLSYLNKVTGEKFVQDFIDAILAIYKTKSEFLAALSLEKKLKDPAVSNWYLVTSVEQSKLKEALELLKASDGLETKNAYIIVNKCLEQSLQAWDAHTEDQTQDLKDSLIGKEKELKKGLDKHFKKVLEFPEIISVSPTDHIQGLMQTWNTI